MVSFDSDIRCCESFLFFTKEIIAQSFTVIVFCSPWGPLVMLSSPVLLKELCFWHVFDASILFFSLIIFPLICIYFFFWDSKGSHEQQPNGNSILGFSSRSFILLTCHIAYLSSFQLLDTVKTEELCKTCLLALNTECNISVQPASFIAEGLPFDRILITKVTITIFIIGHFHESRKALIEGKWTFFFWFLKTFTSHPKYSLSPERRGDSGFKLLAIQLTSKSLTLLSLLWIFRVFCAL